MGSVFKDKQGRWRGTTELPRGKDGKRRKCKPFYGDPSLSEAQQQKMLWSQVHALEYEIKNNLYLNETEETLEEYLEDWFKVYIDNKEHEQTTKELYRLYMDKHIIPDEISSLKIKKMLPIHLQEFYNRKLDPSLVSDDSKKTIAKQPTAKPLSSKTVGKLHSFINLALKEAMRNRLIKYNPCDGVNKPKSKKFKPEICSEENFNKLLSLSRGTFDEVCILLAGVCGLRRGEIFGLRLIDIDFKECRLSIVETMVRMNGKWIIKPPKSDTSKRSIKVPQFVIQVINDYLKTLKVVPERVCAEYKPSSYSQHFKKLLHNNNIPHIRFHDLRHFNAILMMKYGVPDKIASGRLGHSTVQLTREIYQHSTSDMDTEASSVIEGVFVKQDNKDKKAGS